MNILTYCYDDQTSTAITVAGSRQDISTLFVSLKLVVKELNILYIYVYDHIGQLLETYNK